MKITLNNKQAEDSLKTLRSISDGSAINGMLAYKIAKITARIESELSPYLTAKQKVISKYADETDENGVVTKWKDVASANKEYREIASEEIEVEFKALSESDFGMIECSVIQAEMLMKFIDDGKEKD